MKTIESLMDTIFTKHFRQILVTGNLHTLLKAILDSGMGILKNCPRTPLRKNAYLPSDEGRCVPDQANVFHPDFAFDFTGGINTYKGYFKTI